jgi:hypothetical protein
MEISPAPILVTVDGRLDLQGARQLAGWHLMPHDNAADRGAGEPRPRQ